jgi:ABC-2 type transport system permease protein/oleandomycin transport system permease protein
MGYRFDSALGAVAAIALTTAIGFAFSWLGAAIAAKVRQPDMVGMLSMFWLFPLMLASTAFTPAESMPGWLQPFARYQPISVVADSVRGLCEGTPAAGDIALALAWTAGLLIVFVPLSVRLYRSGD